MTKNHISFFSPETELSRVQWSAQTLFEQAELTLLYLMARHYGAGPNDYIVCTWRCMQWCTCNSNY